MQHVTTFVKYKTIIYYFSHFTRHQIVLVTKDRLGRVVDFIYGLHYKSVFDFISFIYLFDHKACCKGKSLTMNLFKTNLFTSLMVCTYSINPF